MPNTDRSAIWASPAGGSLMAAMMGIHEMTDGDRETLAKIQGAGPMASDGWSEEDHQRSANGQFGSGGASAGYKSRALEAHVKSHEAKDWDDHVEAALAHWNAAEAAHHDPAASNLHQLEGDRHRRISQRLRKEPDSKRAHAYNRQATEAADLSFSASTPDEHDEAMLAHWGAAEHARNDPTMGAQAENHQAIGRSHQLIARGLRQRAK